MRFTYAIHDLPADQGAATVLAGGKATSLAVMARDLGLPVPPAFVITTETCRAFLSGGWPDDLDDELRTRMAALETTAGRGFGAPRDPLLVSVRSGAPVSMPGMMDTVLNLGLTTTTVAGLADATGDAEFATDCRERLVAQFRDIVGVDAPDDPWAQLRLAIEAVFRSWQSPRATAFRDREGIPGDLGTAVTVQAMVFGNRGPDSATGVLFTRDPATGAPEPYGDILFDAQGEDVVAGRHATQPIAALDERLPAVAAELRAHAERLERHYADLCDIEFTIEDGRLWFLQVRVGKRSPQAALRMAVDMADDPSFPLTRPQAVERVATLLADPPTRTTSRGGFGLPLATGLPASPGIASGPIVTDPEAAVEAADSGTPAILVRAETSPDDVHGMARAAGILTSAGGLASHAAVVARGWGIPAVVGAAGVTVRDGRVAVGDRILAAGESITIDGGSGEVFEGAIAGSTEVVPEARTLLAWADELGVAVGAREGAAPTGAPASDLAGDAAASTPTSIPADTSSAGMPTPDDCLRAVAIKGFALPEAVAHVVLATPEAVAPILDQLAADGLITTSAGAFKLTDAGTARAGALLQAERDAWGAERAAAALDGFIDLDQRVKTAVTAWQLRDPEAGVVNDHTDSAYDADVLDRLAAVHRDAVAWLAIHEDGCPRLTTYRTRLERALKAARDGDGRYVASPRVDSYHGIWFELHEDLIGLAGRTRAAEVEAGRA